MRKYYQYFGLALIMFFSFYYTDKISNIVLNKNPLMQTIMNEEEKYNIESVNAQVNGKYIVPGINGLQVNKRESFYKMQEFDVFNKYFLVYEQVKPEISLEDNKDKIIKYGNRKYKQVSFILESENEISDYFKSNNIKASLLVNLDTYKENNFFENINNEVNGFKALDNTLNLNKENKKICILNETNKDVCIKSKNYLVEPTLILNSTNLIDVKNSISYGSIILISDTASLSDVKLLLKEIKYKDLGIIYLSELISEENKN